MKFDRIRLENFKCYEQADLSLSAGVTVIHGLNGSGKSSLLEACFFALYGSKALEKTLSEIVTTGAERSHVELWFTHADHSYYIEREIKRRDENARTTRCVLEGEDLTIEGATDVRAHVTGLLRMDTEAFVNCAYVRQGEVNKLINASPSQRQDMIDELLQLGKLETYRERASDARLGVERVRDDKEAVLSEIEDQIADKEAKGLPERQTSVESELTTLDAEIDRYEQNRSQAEQTRDEAEAVLEEYEDKRTELDSIEDDIDSLRERIQSTERTREQLAEDITERRETLSTARKRRDDMLESLGSDLDAPQIEAERERVESELEELTDQIKQLSVEKQEHDGTEQNLLEQATQLQSTAEEKRERAADLAAELGTTRETLTSERERLADLESDIESLQDSFADEPVGPEGVETHHEKATAELADLREELAKRQGNLSNARDRVDEAEQLRAAGKCPECGQPVEGSPHVEALEKRREAVSAIEDEIESLRERESNLAETVEHAEQLLERARRLETCETERANLSELVTERERTIEEKQDRIDRLRREASEAESEAEDKREAATQAAELADECREEIAECNRNRGDLTGRRETLEELSDTIAEIEDLDAEIETLREQRAEKKEINAERRERLAEKQDRREALRDSFEQSRIEEARDRKQRAKQYLEEVEAKLGELGEQKEQLQTELGAIRNELTTLSDLRERRERLRETVDALQSLHEEASQLEEMYGQLRAQLRRRNVESLERMLNETFDLVYENDTYSRIELDGEYQLTVYQKDGQALDPEQLSGGERALFNLSLRCAIYRLLAEGIEGSAPMPPLILDEPTVFLDAGHVSQLVALIDAMRDLGVKQTLVVSHDDELVAAAEELITVRKDPTTNRSTVERANSLDEQRLAADD